MADTGAAINVASGYQYSAVRDECTCKRAANRGRNYTETANRVSGGRGADSGGADFDANIRAYSLTRHPRLLA